MRPTNSGDDREAPGQTRPIFPRAAEVAGHGVESRPRHRHRQVRRSSRLASALRGLVGTLVGGWLVLALLLVGVQVRAATIGQAGPGIAAVIAHLVLAALAIVLQAVADRRDGVVGAGALLGAFGLVFGALWFWWWV